VGSQSFIFKHPATQIVATIRWLCLLLLGAQAGIALSANIPAPLTQVEQIRSLSRKEAARALPVQLRGVVVYHGWNALVLHDGKASVFLDFRYAQAQGVWRAKLPDLNKIPPGTALEVAGVTNPGGFSPMVLVANFKAIGTQPIPPPLRPDLEQLLSSSLNSQWVEVEGVVRKFDNDPSRQQSLTLLIGGHLCPVLLRHRTRLSDQLLVDARVRVRGVYLDIANLRSQTAGMKIHSNGRQDIEILVPPPPDPFQAEKVSLNKLLTFHPDADLGHRRVSSGVVTFAVPGRFFYLMGEGVSVRVDSVEARVSPGDRVEVSGFIDTSRVFASFSEALVRKIGTGTIPALREPSISEILNPKTRSLTEMVTEPGSSDFDGRLMRLDGVLRRVLPPNRDGPVTIVLESNGNLVQALLHAPPPNWREGSVVEATGVCELEMDRIDRSPWFTISGFHLWLSGPGDLRIISEPPWWTPQRLAILLAALVLVLALTLGWGAAMRRQVTLRSGQLATEIAARESSQLEFKTILRERRRLANDLHDTLEQTLTGLALQLEIASRSSATDAQLSQHHLRLARQFLEKSRSEAHRTIWDLRDHGQDGRSFPEILREQVAAMVEGSGISINLRQQGESMSLPDLIEANLLLLAREAVTNALKHSGASEISILLRLSGSHAELVIEDNGSGFDPETAPNQHAGHFGLQGMRERTKRLHGKFEIDTIPGKGTTTRVSVPLGMTESQA